jgi:ABC-2 type transport system ATP-binding protein
MRPVLEIDALSFDYGGRSVLDAVSLRIDADEKVILLGPNGAGKTTLFALVSGLFATRKGRVSVAGAPAGTGPALAALGVVFQMQTLDLDLSVDQNLGYAAALHGLSPRLAAPRIAAAKQVFGLQDLGAEKLRSLNGGHRRRVEIARSGLHDPQVLLLDEPTVGLDIATRKALVADLHARPGALLWATHLIDEIWPDDRVLVLHQGRLVADGPQAALMAQTATDSLSAAFDALTRVPA